MTWRGSVLSADQRDVRAALDAFVAQQPPVLTDDSPEDVARVVGELGGLGFWALGAAESVGGGGADRATTLVALERLGRAWPAIGWACVQAHAALRVLEREPRLEALAEQVSAGATAVAVVDATSGHVRIERDGPSVVSSVPRIDVAHPAPYVLFLTADAGLLVPPGGVTATPLRRTGLAGAMTRSIEVATSSADVIDLPDMDTAGVRGLLRLGAAAVASGIAAAAADDARAYATERRQFGDALTALATVRTRLLEQAIRAAVVLNAALAAPLVDEVATLAVAREACDAAVEVAAAAIQSHGGYGYLVEYDVERRLRDAVSLRAATDLQGSSAAVARTLVGHRKDLS